MLPIFRRLSTGLPPHQPLCICIPRTTRNNVLLLQRRLQTETTGVNIKQLKDALEKMKTHTPSSELTLTKPEDNMLMLLKKRSKIPAADYYVQNKGEEYSSDTLLAVLQGLRDIGRRPEHIQLFHKIIESPQHRRCITDQVIKNELVFLSRVGPTKSFWSTVKLLRENNLNVPSDTYSLIVENYWAINDVSKVELFVSLLERLKIELSQDLIRIMVQQYQKRLMFTQSQIYLKRLEGPLVVDRQKREEKKELTTGELVQRMVNKANPEHVSSPFYDGKYSESTRATLEEYVNLFSQLYKQKMFEYILYQYKSIPENYKSNGKIIVYAIRSCDRTKNKEYKDKIISDMERCMPYVAIKQMAPLINSLKDSENTKNVIEKLIENNPTKEKQKQRALAAISIDRFWDYYQEKLSSDMTIKRIFFEGALVILLKAGDNRVSTVVRDMVDRDIPMTMLTWGRMRTHVSKGAEEGWCRRAMELFPTMAKQSKGSYMTSILRYSLRCIDYKQTLSFYEKHRSEIDGEYRRRCYILFMKHMTPKDNPKQKYSRIENLLKLMEEDGVSIPIRYIERNIQQEDQWADTIIKMAKRRNLVQE